MLLIVMASSQYACTFTALSDTIMNMQVFSLLLYGKSIAGDTAIFQNGSFSKSPHVMRKKINDNGHGDISGWKGSAKVLT